MSHLYDHIGQGYHFRRKADYAISSAIYSELQNISSVLNVGAGAGSYEPEDKAVIAAEPSINMIRQRQNRFNVVQAIAEALPFLDDSFDAVLAILTIHHWKDKRKGLLESARIARKRIIILTWDPQSDGFWLVSDYFPQILATDRAIFPSMAEISSVLGSISVKPLPIPANCTDGFLGAYWHRPHAYLDASVRAGMSGFYRIHGIEPQLEKLRHDVLSGAWNRRYRRLLSVHALDIGYRLVVAQLN